MNDKGFIQLPRTVLQPDLFRNQNDFRIFTFLYLNACFTGYRVNNDINLERGQFLRSFRKLQDDLAYIDNRQIKVYSLSTIKRSVDRLENDLKLIKTHGTQLGTLFTVLNYCNTNDSSNQNHELGTELGTTAKQLRNNNNNVYKNDKEVINEEENKKQPSKKRSFFDDYITAFGRQPTPIQIEKLNQYIEEGIDIDLLCFAFKKTALVTSNFNYLQSILNDWIRKGIKTIAHIEQQTLTTKESNEHGTDRQKAWKSKFGF